MTGKVRFTNQSSKITPNVLQRGWDPRGHRYFRLHERKLVAGIEADTGVVGIRHGAYPSFLSRSTSKRNIVLLPTTIRFPALSRLGLHSEALKFHAWTIVRTSRTSSAVIPTL